MGIVVRQAHHEWYETSVFVKHDEVKIKMERYLAIDVGTTGLKVALIENSGKILASEYTEYPILSPQPGYAEQDPEAWWQGLIEGCKNLQEKSPQEFSKIVGIGICGQMHTQVYLDKERRVI